MFNNLNRQAWLSFSPPQILRFKKNFFSFINLWLFWVFSLVVVSRRLLFLAMRGTGFPLQWLLLLQSTSCRCMDFSCCDMWAPEWQFPGPRAALQHAGSSWTRSWTHVSCIYHCTYHWATREAPKHDHLCHGLGDLGPISFYLANSILVSFGDQLSPIGCSLRLGICFDQTALLYPGQEIETQFKLPLFIDQNLNLSRVERRPKKNTGILSTAGSVPWI